MEYRFQVSAFCTTSHLLVHLGKKTSQLKLLEARFLFFYFQFFNHSPKSGWWSRLGRILTQMCTVNLAQPIKLQGSDVKTHGVEPMQGNIKIKVVCAAVKRGSEYYETVWKPSDVHLRVLSTVVFKLNWECCPAVVLIRRFTPFLSSWLLSTPLLSSPAQCVIAKSLFLYSIPGHHDLHFIHSYNLLFSCRLSLQNISYLVFSWHWLQWYKELRRLSSRYVQCEVNWPLSLLPDPVCVPNGTLFSIYRTAFDQAVPGCCRASVRHFAPVVCLLSLTLPCYTGPNWQLWLPGQSSGLSLWPHLSVTGILKCYFIPPATTGKSVLISASGL